MYSTQKPGSDLNNDTISGLNLENLSSFSNQGWGQNEEYWHTNSREYYPLITLYWFLIIHWWHTQLACSGHYKHWNTGWLSLAIDCHVAITSHLVHRWRSNLFGLPRMFIHILLCLFVYHSFSFIFTSGLSFFWGPSPFVIASKSTFLLSHTKQRQFINEWVRSTWLLVTHEWNEPCSQMRLRAWCANNLSFWPMRCSFFLFCHHFIEI